MGTLVFQATLGGAINLIGPNTASTVNFTLPSADGTSGQALTTNGSGTLAFTTVTGVPSGSTTQVQYNSSGAFAGSANLTFDGTNLTTGGTNTATRFIPSGSTVATNGMYLQAANTLGFSTNSTEAMRIDSAGRVGIGPSGTSSSATIFITKNITGSTVLWNTYTAGTIQSDVTNQARMYVSSPSTAASAFTLSTLGGFTASQNTIGAGSTVTTQYGFEATSSLTGATNNYGFFGSIASGTGRYNLYMNGTADNYLAGSTGIGAAPSAISKLYLGGTYPTSSTLSYISYMEGTIPSGTTGATAGYVTSLSTQASAFNLSTLSHFQANQGTIGATSTVGSQYGFYAQSNLTGATNNYGFYGNIASGTGRYNLYMNGTADNFLGGNLGIGAITSGATLTVRKNITGGTTAYGILQYSTISSDVTSTANIVQTFPSTTASAFTLANLRHFYSSQDSIGAGSTVTNQYGFSVESTLTGATNNYGFYGNIASGTGRYNLYMNGTAQNYFAGNVGIATTSPGSALDVKGTLRLSGATSGYVGLAPAAAAGSTTYTLPSADGTTGQLLSTNGSGTLSWASGSGASAATPTALGTVYASTTTTSTDIVAFGYQAGNSSTGSYSTAIGYQTLLTNSGAYNTAIGYQSLQNPTGGRNVAIGRTVLQVNTSGNFNVGIGGANTLGANTTGAYNIAIGDSALYTNTTSSNLTAVGYQAGNLSTGSGNQFFGYSSGSAVTSGAKNVIVGSYTGSAAPISATGSNFVVLSDGDGNIVASSKTAQTFALAGGTLSSGTGIAFPATQSASSDANTLDDYEEGTWTPSVGGTATYTAQQATYTKIGRVVHVTAYIQILLIGTGSTIQITGFPFATATTSNFVNCARVQTSATNIVSLNFTVGSTTAQLISRTAAAASDSTGSPIFQNSTLVELNGFYFV